MRKRERETERLWGRACREREKKGERERERERDGERERIPSRLLAVHAELDVGLNHMTLRSCPEPKSRARR